MNKAIFQRLNSIQHNTSSKALRELLSHGKLNKLELKQVLNIKNKLTIGDFLETYTDFDKQDLIFIEKYIQDNLDHPNRLFVSDLIEFSSIWNIELPYEKCIENLKKYYNDDDYVQLATIDYIYSNLKLKFIDEIYDCLNSILNNTECNQSSQVQASFVLYRITNKREYLVDLIDLIINGHPDNKKLVANLLIRKSNSDLYFSDHNLLNKIVLQHKTGNNS